MNRSQAIDLLVSIAKKEVGTKEIGGNNRGPRIREYQGATWLAPGPWAWCAAFVCWVIREWLKNDEVKKILGNPGIDWRPQGAGAFWFAREWAKDRKISVYPNTVKILKGDIIVYDFSHIGIAESDETAGVVDCVEGNSNGAGTRDSETGDGVWLKNDRPKHLILYVIRLLDGRN